jgi:hypothetical protein
MRGCDAAPILVSDDRAWRLAEGGVMTDVAVPESVGPPLDDQPDKLTSSANAHSVLRLVLVLIGLAGGAIGFWGFFVNFFHRPNTGLYSVGSVWFDLIPIFIGIGLIGLAMPGWLTAFTSGLPLLAMGIVFGIHGTLGGGVVAGLGASWGYGFYMISAGSGILTLASLSLVALWIRHALRQPAVESLPVNP